MNNFPALAVFRGRVASGLTDVTHDPEALDSEGFWAVVADFEGHLTCARFRDVRPLRRAAQPVAWRGPAPQQWSSSLDRDAYTTGVQKIREHIAAGDVYQTNLCRILTAPVGPDADIKGLADRLSARHHAPYAAMIRLPSHGIEVASTSPELFLRRDGQIIQSGPIKGTGRTADDLLEKDHAENVMIVDLVRNDLSQVCETGSVSVPRLCSVEQHPGLVHLVSIVRGALSENTGWKQLFAAAFPPGSVTGTPKHSALGIIRSLETSPRGPYCGGIGWVDADRHRGELAVGIRTFWIDRTRSRLCFGTGAGITWGSDPHREWDETKLKAERLVSIASNGGPSGPDGRPRRAPSRP
ncbi:chorismate-binding protein [Streptomyces olivaceus]|uniref:chorismate-binding protein n=1 Tax=Streptomyces olivaceus TaxID=47716 RepID=UPI00381956EE